MISRLPETKLEDFELWSEPPDTYIFGYQRVKNGVPSKKLPDYLKKPGG